ncbi:hypothetical protein RMCBS344292_11175 [Rhizopus microsporus]|nr:hypothetical protein RMCBS344292_11175 [Rhizopus microsporus]
MSLAIKRRRVKDENNNVKSVRTHHLFVLDKKHWVQLVDAIVSPNGYTQDDLEDMERTRMYSNRIR